MKRHNLPFLDGSVKAIPCALLLVLAGCVQAPQWHKDGATQEQISEDAKLCQNESLKVVQNEDRHIRSTYGQEMDKSARRRELTTVCMRAKNYEMDKDNSLRR